MIRKTAIVWVGLLLLIAGPSIAKPNKPHTGAGAAVDLNKAAEANGEKIRRAMDAQNRRWDAEMRKATSSICRGC
jgi:hypothetical protein